MAANQMRGWIEIFVQFAQDPDLRQFVLGPQRRVRADYTSGCRTGPGPGQMTLAAAAANFLVPFGSVVRANYLYVVSFDDIQFRLDSPTAPLKRLVTIPADTSGNPLSNEEKYKQPGLMLICGTDVTALYLTNMSATLEAGVYVGLIGEGQS